MDVPRFLKKPESHFFLLGPRGTGKSWWTRKTFADALRVDLLVAATLRELVARPERLRDMVHGVRFGRRAWGLREKFDPACC